MKFNSKTVIGLGALGVAGYLAWQAWQKYSSTTAGVFVQSLSGYRAQQREAEKSRAQAFLAAASGRQTTDALTSEIVNQASGMSSSNAAAMRAVMVRKAVEGQATPAAYGTLGVPGF